MDRSQFGEAMNDVAGDGIVRNQRRTDIHATDDNTKIVRS